MEDASFLSDVVAFFKDKLCISSSSSILFPTLASSLILTLSVEEVAAGSLKGESSLQEELWLLAFCFSFLEEVWTRNLCFCCSMACFKRPLSAKIGLGFEFLVLISDKKRCLILFKIYLNFFTFLSIYGVTPPNKKNRSFEMPYPNNYFRWGHEIKSRWKMMNTLSLNAYFL